MVDLPDCLRRPRIHCKRHCQLFELITCKLYNCLKGPKTGITYMGPWGALQCNQRSTYRCNAAIHQHAIRIATQVVGVPKAHRFMYLVYFWVPKTHRLPTAIQCNCNTNRSSPICFIERDIHYILIIIELNHYNRPSIHESF